MNGQLPLIQPTPTRLPLAELRIDKLTGDDAGGFAVAAAPTEGRWAGKFEIRTHRPGDALYLLKLLLRELAERGDA